MNAYRCVHCGKKVPFRPLTPRQVSVLKLVAEGDVNKEIAIKLHLKEQTIKNYIAEICRRLDVPNRTQAVVKGLLFGIITLEQLTILTT